MPENITWEMLLALIVVGGAVAGIWRHFNGSVTKVDADLQAYKLHVAETYASSTAVTSQIEAVSKSITAIGERMEVRLDGVNERLDRVIEAGKPRVL